LMRLAGSGVTSNQTTPVALVTEHSASPSNAVDAKRRKVSAAAKKAVKKVQKRGRTKRAK
jgi:hypothetical protein